MQQVKGQVKQQVGQADLFGFDAAPTVAEKSVSPTIVTEDYAAWRIVVPTFEHAQLLLKALQKEIGSEFIPPRILTMFAWTEQQTPLPVPLAAPSERLSRLYAELRQHEWLKNLFGTRSNTDLLPLAQTLLGLCDELTEVWLPKVLDAQGQMQPEKMASVWQQALASLPTPVKDLVSEESQLVWTLWQAQLDQHDRSVQYLQKTLTIAAHASEHLLWVAPTLPNAMESAFLQAYANTGKNLSGEIQTQVQAQVHVASIDWQSRALPAAMLSAWPRLLGDESLPQHSQSSMNAWPSLASSASSNINALDDFKWQRLRLCAASNMEDEARQAAQTIVEWLQAGKSEIAVIAQDRVVSRRLRALLERAQVLVADETGWKLSTTRAAAVVAAWFEVIISDAETMALLDFIKSPFIEVFEDDVRDANRVLLTDLNANTKAELVMQVELTLRGQNVLGGWEAILAALDRHPAARQWMTKIARLAHSYGRSSAANRRQLKEWTKQSLLWMAELGLDQQLDRDSAGQQVIKMLQALGQECEAVVAPLSFNEWRAFLLLHMENTPFTIKHHDQRVVMLPLNGARLRTFDAVYVIGADAKHLPSRPQETLFFTNTVRRECGLQTREERQLQQLRDLAELMLSNHEIVLSWQTELNGEFNPVSPWIEQLELDLARQAQAALMRQRLPLQRRQLSLGEVTMPTPTAAPLMPNSLSASGLSSLMACPYQFFAGRMLKLSALDELSDMPEKRDYGDWLHAILKNYHDQLRDKQIPLREDHSERIALLKAISDDSFGRVLKQNPAALGYSLRWTKVIPAYVEWANQRESDGWQYALGEVWAERTMQWDKGHILLRGRLDRIDERALDNGDYERVVLDYKTKKKGALSSRLKTHEDHQLAFYGLLRPVAEVDDAGNKQYIDAVDGAAYVALELERNKTGDCEAQEYGKWKHDLEELIVDSMQAIQQGSPLPAHGVESVCQFCDMRGLCRKGAWQ
ncbi:PD-(D/E)XK nuclease family protein [Undibacterium cyanobacteriorum]|uniref:PD-(D/E)XK nuclease family protein n=1 Tax=Undibacterium cyanobacteriorum TaxID=3073561 RepID=A0ABY9RMR7_9BURK|nr:PD-(D/E)XK nuclease family protein [Undibacterium sp. 20NA77.5]WMW82114.1 PD-(D/E)XK nuclease family protein [Undibacterium sp. 20NA77.5]